LLLFSSSSSFLQELNIKGTHSKINSSFFIVLSYSSNSFFILLFLS
jgi:hypothetical protein